MPGGGVMKRSAVFALVLLCAFLPSLANSDAQFETLVQARSFECVYLSATFGYWSEGSTFAGISEKGPESEPVAEMTFKSIDLQKGEAIIQTPWEEREVEVVNGIRGLTFIDYGSLGMMRMVTVFPYLCPERQAFCSVLSEHTSRSGSASPTQAFGFCRAR